MDEEKNLFGEKTSVSENKSLEKLKNDLKEYDTSTLSERASRLELIQELRDNHDLLIAVDFEGNYLFKECEKSYINGLFASTIILTHGIIDRILEGMLTSKGFQARGSKKRLDLIEQEKLMHPFLIKEIDKLRRKRNRFMHLVKHDDGMQLEDRMATSELNSPIHLIEKDAEFAIRLLYEFYSTGFS